MVCVCISSKILERTGDGLACVRVWGEEVPRLAEKLAAPARGEKAEVAAARRKALRRRQERAHQDYNKRSVCVRVCFFWKSQGA